jgi:hypothetical protein
MAVRRVPTFSLCAAAALLVLAAAPGAADVCRFPPTRLAVRAPQLLSCVDAKGDVLSACVEHCGCRELQHSIDQTSWGVCIETLPTKPCLDPRLPSTTRRQCPHSTTLLQSVARRLQANGTAPASLPTTAATSSSSASTGSEMSRDTMIIVVACVVAVFAVVVVVVVVRTRKHHDGNADDILPTTPTEGGAYNEFTSVEISPQPTATTTTTTLKPFIHRPSAAYTERTTLASNGRDSVTSPHHQEQEQDHRDDEDDEIAMLGSYIEPRAYNGNTFVSVVSFGEDDGTSSTGSTDVDALRSESNTMLSTGSSRDWRYGDDDTLLESNGSAWSFADAQEALP